MNKQQISKLNMYLAVQKTLQANQKSIDGFARLKTEVTRFNDYLSQINQINTDLSTGTKGITNGNTELERNMVEAVCKLSRAALVWAKDEKNSTLIKLFDVSKSDFIRLPDADCYAKANAVMSEIEANGKKLAVVNIKDSAITATRNLVNAYQASLGSTQSALKNNKSLNAETKSLFANADVSLNNISDLVVNALDDAAFANALMATKVINDAAVRSTGVTIAVTDAESNEPIKTAWAYVEGSDKKDDADQDGLCELYKMRAGNYTIRIEAEGYKTTKLNVTVEQGKITALETELAKS